MPRRNTEYEQFKRTCGGWFHYHGNIKLKEGDIARATLFTETEDVAIVITRPYIFEQWFCRITDKYSADYNNGMEYLVDRTMITQILIDEDYNLRRKRDYSLRRKR